ncbi:CASPprotein [Dictyocaulus viviparus]|uniref:CASPprotein n=1 Tax=Dictyocaulus viviparus TaxID=29172 RepID=A0A0D8XRP6_DICVI|nr:CASPprotein [Dictyocaulus viviparus]
MEFWSTRCASVQCCVERYPDTECSRFTVELWFNLSSSSGKHNLSRIEAEVVQLRSENDTQKELIAKLETDLAAAFSGRNVIAKTDPNNDDLSTMDMLGIVHETKLENDSNSVLTIALAQRDRMKLRIGVLEEELITEKTRQSVLQTEMKKLQEDNVKLYGKIKFLQGYGSRSPETSVPLPEEGDYSVQYERRLDPFQRFGQAETQRKVELMTENSCEFLSQSIIARKNPPLYGISDLMNFIVARLKLSSLVDQPNPILSPVNVVMYFEN